MLILWKITNQELEKGTFHVIAHHLLVFFFPAIAFVLLTGTIFPLQYFVMLILQSSLAWNISFARYGDMNSFIFLIFILIKSM